MFTLFTGYESQLRKCLTCKCSFDDRCTACFVNVGLSFFGDLMLQRIQFVFKAVFNNADVKYPGSQIE